MNGDYINNQTEQEDILDNFPELKLSLDDAELQKLTKRWRAEGKVLEGKVKDRWQENIDLWRGIQKTKSTKRNVKENRVFTGLETFLPILTRQNPEASVEPQERNVGDEMAEILNKELAYITDTQRLKLKIKQAARNWCFYHLGIMKIEWNSLIGEIEIKPLVAKRMYFDPHGYVEDGIFMGRYLGEESTMLAKDFVEKYPKSKEKVGEKTKGNLDSQIKYIQWWTNEYMLIQFEDTFPFKVKNPNYNYQTENETFDETGQPVTVTVEPKNHFVRPMYPYAFMHVYESEPSVYDETSILQQTKDNQYTLNERISQVDKNVESMNNSLIAYGLDENKAISAKKAIEKGGMITFSDRTVEGMERVSPPGLPSDVYNEMQIQRDAIDQIFATNAVTRGEDTRDQTVRGKIIARQSDESRIGFIAEYVEQMVDYVYNYCVQMMYVYYEKAWVSELPETPYLVSVKEGSMIPRDPLTVRNEAIDLFSAGALDLETLYERLDFEDPRDAAVRTMLYFNDPMAYMTEILGYQPQQPAMPTSPPVGDIAPIEGDVAPIPGL